MSCPPRNSGKPSLVTGNTGWMRNSFMRGPSRFNSCPPLEYSRPAAEQSRSNCGILIVMLRCFAPRIELGILWKPAVLARPGNDRLTVTDLGYGRASGPVHVLAKLHLTGLADQNGNVVMVSASFKASIRRGRLAIDRSGELLLARGDQGHWTIIGYNLRTRRAIGAAPSSTTTAHTPSASSTTTGAKP